MTLVNVQVWDRAGARGEQDGQVLFPSQVEKGEQYPIK